MARDKVKQWASVGRLVSSDLLRWRGRALAMMGLVVLSFSVHLIYGGVLAAGGAAGLDAVKEMKLPVDLIVTRGERFPAAFSAPNMAGDMMYTVAYHEETISLSALTSKGEMTTVGIDPGSAFYDPDKVRPTGKMPTQTGEIAIPRDLASSRKIGLGDTIKLSTVDARDGAERKAEFVVVGVFTAPFDRATPVILKSDAMKLQAQPGANQWMVQIYDEKNAPGLTSQRVYVQSTFARNLGLLTSWVRHNFPEAQIVTVASARDVAATMIEGSNSSGWSLIALVNMFMGVGVLTISLITFLERRRELAVLKTIGVSNQQIAATLTLEQAIPAVLGMVIGYLIALIFGSQAAYAQLAGASWRGLVSRGIVQTSAVVFFAAFLPTLTARVATVNQLLFARVIPVVQRNVSELQQQYSWMVEREREEGVRFLRLEVNDGVLQCFLLKRVGEMVKTGEVVASKQSLFGLVNKEWRSPVNGQVIEFNSTSGYLTIQVAAEPEAQTEEKPRAPRRIGSQVQSPI
ncbi:MAG: ABC transporter permease [Bacillota bacterium]